MPQFDFANVFVPQLFWLSVFFIVLYFGVVKTTLPRLGKVMDEREGKITGDLESARKSKERADALADEVEADLAAKREDARARIAAAKADAGKASEKRLKAADTRIGKKLAEAEARIDEARREAGDAIREIAVDSTQSIVAKLTGGEPDRTAAEAEVDAALAQRA